MTKEKEKTYISSVEKFNKWINVINTHDKEGRKEMVYRGLKDRAWELSTSLYRRLEKNNLQTDMQRFIRATEELIKTAKGEGHHEKMTNLNLLAELQHNGAATCLIDFTKAPLVALWFACQPITKEELSQKPKGYKSEGGKIVALNTKFFHQLIGKNRKKIQLPF